MSMLELDSLGFVYRNEFGKLAMLKWTMQFDGFRYVVKENWANDGLKIVTLILGYLKNG